MKKRTTILTLLMGLLITPAFAQDAEKQDGQKKKKANAAKKQDGEKKKKRKKLTDEEKAKRTEMRKKKAAEARKKRGARSYVMNMLKAVELTDDQTASVKKVAAAYDPKFQALRLKQEKLLTPEQKAAQDASRKQARDARKAAAEEAKNNPAKKKEGAAATGEKKNAAARKRGRQQNGQRGGIKYSEEQRKARQEIATAQKELRTEVVGKLKTVLSEEQMSLLPGAGRQRRGAKKGKKKNAEKKKKKPTDDK